MHSISFYFFFIQSDLLSQYFSHHAASCLATNLWLSIDSRLHRSTSNISLSLSLYWFNREHLRVILILNYELCLLLLLNCVLYNCIADLLYFSNLNKVDFYLWVCRFSIKEKVNLVAVISLPCSVVLLSNG